MAAYRADIEIGVRGARNLEQLRSSINQTAQAVDSLNEVVSARGSLVQNIQNYTNNLNRAAESLRRVGANTPAETKAIREYAQALGEANTARARQNALVAQELANQRRVVPGTAGYGQQGPALPPAIVKGQQVAQAWKKFFTEAEQVGKELQSTSVAKYLNVKNSWQKFFTEAADSATELQLKTKAEALNTKASWTRFFIEAQNVAADLAVEAQRTAAAVRSREGAASEAARQRLSEEAATRQRMRDAGFGQQGPALPPQPTAAQQAKTVDTQKRLNNLLASAQLLEQKIAQYRAKGLDVTEQHSLLQRVLTSLQQEGLATTKQYLTTVDNILNSVRNELKVRKAIADTARATTAAQNKSAPTQVSTSGAKEQTGRGKEALSNAIIGGAFPLLFGQGLGSSIGGGLGGAVGGLLGGQFGFGLSLVGTALGQTFDNAAQSAADFSKALKDTGDASAVLETALGRVDKTTKTTIQNLAKSGQQAAAAEASFQALAAEIGTEQAEAFRRAGEATTAWGANLQKWLTKTYANVVLLGEAISNNFPTGPGIQGPSSVFDLVEAQPQQALSQEARDRIEDLAGQNALLEKQVALSRLTVDASVDQRLQLERQVALQTYVNDATELERQLKQKLLSDQEYTLRLKAAELRFTQQLFEVENAAQQARQRKAEEAQRAAEKAQREAERAAQKQLQTLNNIRNLQVSLTQQALESADIDVARVRAADGEIAALKEGLSQLQARLNIEARILDIQLEQQLSAQDITDQERVLYESIYKQQRANLEAQYQIKARTQQLDIARLQTARQILFAEKDRAVQDIKQQRGTQLAGLQAELAFPFGGAGLDAVNQHLEQQARRYETLVPLQRELQNLETERANIAASASAQELQDLNERISGKLAQIELEGQYLNQLDATEKALLRQQQIYAKYGFIADEVSTALSDSITGLITGTATVTEAFSRMFESIGKAFIDMATQMLAQKLFMTVLGALIPGGSSIVQGVDVPMAQMPAGMAFAEGGFVTGPTRALIGEGGEPEYVIPASKMRSAMGRYAGGARGASVIPGNGEGGGGGMGAAPSGTIDVRYSIERINNVDYVTAEQFQRGMAQAAQQGAIQGERRAMRTLQNSTATRRRISV